MRYRTLALFILLQFLVISVSGAPAEQVTLDSYALSNNDSTLSVSNVQGRRGIGQTFSYTGGASHRVLNVEWGLSIICCSLRNTILVSQIWTVQSQAYTALPDTLLGESEQVPALSINSNSEFGGAPIPVVFNFNNSQQAILNSNTIYSAVLTIKTYAGNPDEDEVNVARDSSSATHQGRAFQDVGTPDTGWVVLVSTTDFPFAVRTQTVSGGGGGGGNGNGEEQPLPTGPLAGGTGALLILGGVVALVFSATRKRRR